MIPKSGQRFPACAKPSDHMVITFRASAGEGRSGKIMRRQVCDLRQVADLHQVSDLHL
jgi:hypothetical protein